MKHIKIFLSLLTLLVLSSCFGPELFTIAGFKVTAGTAVTVPAKIEAYEKYKEEKEKKEYKQEEHKKRFQVNKIDERTLEIYY
jgi:hypothetical protein